MELHGVCHFHRGHKKDMNEDNFLFDKTILEDAEAETGEYEVEYTGVEHACFAVFDGMGGLPDGEVAAATAAKMLLEAADDRKRRLEDTLEQIDQKIAAFSEENGCQIGTTAAIVSVDEKCCTVANVGDSRVYRLKQRKLEQLSEDHSDRKLLEELGVEGRTPSLLQFLGKKSLQLTINPAVSTVKHGGKGRYLICSDGLTDMVPDQEIQSICNEMSDLKECAKRLVQSALENGGKDNITVILFDLRDGALPIRKRIGIRIDEVIGKIRNKKATE